jgi:hypothetical protein
MAVDRSYVARNDTQRRRLRALVDRLSEEDLSRPLAGGWTVAGVLAHMAFWDQRALVLLDVWKAKGAAAGAVPRDFDDDMVDWINDAAKPLILAMPPRIAANVAVDAAVAADERVAGLSDELLAANERTGSYINVLRAEHRREHLDEIEQARSHR